MAPRGRAVLCTAQMSATAIFVIVMVVLTGVRVALRRTSPSREALDVFLRRVGGVPIRTEPDPFSRVPPERKYMFRLREIEITIWPHVFADDKDTIIEMSAPLAVPPAPAIALNSGDRAPESLAAAWASAVGAVGQATVRCDGQTVFASARYRLDADGIAAVAEVVALMCRRDEGLGDTLLALPDATPLEGHALVPGVVLGLDGLVIGVRDRSHVVAQLDDVSFEGELPGPTRELVARAGDGELLATAEGARFTWRGIERDPARLRAGVDALRSLRGATGPYR